jgi:hypothetical protein
MDIAEHSPANVEHHRPVAADEGGESNFVACADPTVYQVSVRGRPRVGPRDETT